MPGQFAHAQFVHGLKVSFGYFRLGVFTFFLSWVNSPPHLKYLPSKALVAPKEGWRLKKKALRPWRLKKNQTVFFFQTGFSGNLFMRHTRTQIYSESC